MALQKDIFTVSRLNNSVKTILEYEFNGIWLIGEISNFVQPASGHWYFSLKDNTAQVKSAMFRGNNRSVRFIPSNGQQVLVKGRVSMYTPRGDYQFIVEQMEPAGDGLLMQQFEQLKTKLAAQGLFNAVHKKSLPKHIHKVGVITSPTGAAIKDILTVLKRRAPQLEVIIYPSTVQGSDANKQLIDSINIANTRNEVDVLLIGRGGGSLEDLWCFNDEALAHAIYASQLPVVSAVGHEIDTTIADFVADIRAATPSAAAELVSPDQSELVEQLNYQRKQLRNAMLNTLKQQQYQLHLLQGKLSYNHPASRLQQQSQRLDELTMRMQHTIQSLLSSRQHQLIKLQQRLEQHSPKHAIARQHTNVSQLNQRLVHAISSKLEKEKHTLALQAGQLDAFSPLKILGRGYSITSHAKSGKIIKLANDVKVGETLKTQLSEGVIYSEVKELS
ncbi:exodeoxyribonuclease VII large subunit [Flocculibacter collagenilyticus]|uniref:exodeoxyribonuclease VII large subunit n=1 Tax=Flocculibacter collagenilyticus TaxID=2744479 RepID=UPI0018F45629|nr:exodeoxyribonuclease VII large subunit [Flocculibacter collagenilyticus]